MDKTHCDRWLSQLDLPKLSVEESADLDNLITLEEIRGALQSMQKGKSPGFDGTPPPEFDVTFWEQLGPFLLDMINFSLEKGKFSRDVNTALISLLLKKDKDPTECSNYQPLSLLNSDIKIFVKLLAHHLEPHMSKLINSDQTGFIIQQIRMAADNVRCLLTPQKTVRHLCHFFS